LCLLGFIVAVGLSAVGVQRDKRRLLALVALVVSGGLALAFLAAPGDVSSFISALGR
jgi:hypothetical protein